MLYFIKNMVFLIYCYLFIYLVLYLLNINNLSIVLSVDGKVVSKNSFLWIN